MNWDDSRSNHPIAIEDHYPPPDVQIVADLDLKNGTFCSYDLEVVFFFCFFGGLEETSKKPCAIGGAIAIMVTRDDVFGTPAQNPQNHRVVNLTSLKLAFYPKRYGGWKTFSFPSLGGSKCSVFSEAISNLVGWNYESWVKLWKSLKASPSKLKFQMGGPHFFIGWTQISNCRRFVWKFVTFSRWGLVISWRFFL